MNLTDWHNYALSIKNGDISACKRLKQAVNRYFIDLDNPNYYFDSDVVTKFTAFSKACPHVKGHLRSKPIVLEPWQQFLFANLLGFKHIKTGLRKYRSAYVQVPRKNAKSTTAAILANWFLVMEKGQQDIYTAAVSRDQARIVFDDARQMAILSKPIKKRVTIQQHKVINPKRNSLLRPLASKAATIEGTNPSLSIVDEYHLHPDNGVYSALELGMGARPEGILFAITTAGSNTISACKQHYDYCCQILAGDENEIDNPNLWIKANPNLDISVDRVALEDTIKKARGIPSQWVEMLTKRFNIWCNGATPWVNIGSWNDCKLDYTESDLKGLDCYAGLDLSSTNDITSVCYSFPFETETRLLTRHYIPEFQLNNVANKNREMYRKWVNQGWIRVTKGDCIDYDQIRDDILKDSEEFNIKLIGFDVWNATQLRTQLQNLGLDVEPFPQTYARYSPTSKTAEVFISRNRIRHNGDPVLAWAVGNVVMETDANANIKPNKKKAANKIDPAVAFLMSFGTYLLEYGEVDINLTDAQKSALTEFKGIEL